MTNLYLISLYYLKDRVTGANKRFDELGKRHLRSKQFDTYVIVLSGQKPDWCPEDKVIYIYPYKSKAGRVLSWLHLSLRLWRLKPGVVYSDFQPIPLFCGFFHKHFQLIHDLRNWTSYGRKGLGVLSAYFQRTQLKSAGKIVTVSHYSKRDIINKCGLNDDDVIVSYNGIEKVFENMAINSRDIMYDFVYVATFEARKNHLRLIKALEMIKDNVNVCLIGRDLGSKPEVLEYISNSKSANLKNITFFDSVTEEELHNIYSASKFFISPSLLEGFGMPLIEAAARGVKVVCSNLEVFEELMGDNAIYFDPLSEIDICNAMLKALNHDIDNVQNLNVDEFIWENIALKLESNFNSCC